VNRRNAAVVKAGILMLYCRNLLWRCPLDPTAEARQSCRKVWMSTGISLWGNHQAVLHPCKLGPLRFWTFDSPLVYTNTPANLCSRNSCLKLRLTPKLSHKSLWQSISAQVLLKKHPYHTERTAPNANLLVPKVLVGFKHLCGLSTLLISFLGCFDLSYLKLYRVRSWH